MLMRFFFALMILLPACCGTLFSQQPCKRSSSVFHFDPHARPRLFTEKLGNHPQFPFLQYEKGIVTRALFLKAMNHPDSRKLFRTEFGVLNALLRDIGFVRGYKEVRAVNIENVFLNPGTIGNLGFFNKESNYIYVKLNPAGEGDDGVAAWKITGPGGCYVYILHTCGNAFFIDEAAMGSTGCCREVTVKATTDSVSAVAPRDRALHLHLRFYQGLLTASKKHPGFDTAIRLIRSIDTVTRFKEASLSAAASGGTETVQRFVLCRDTVLTLHVPFNAGTQGVDSLESTFADTSWLKFPVAAKEDCRKKWEITLDGGASFNSVPRFDNSTQHSRTNGAGPAAELTVSRIFSHWFQAGLSAAYLTLSYQDDLAYPGATPNTYNTVSPGKPIIPLQIFGKATIGGPLGWQANVSLSAGYSLVSGDKIVNSGTTLTTKPGTKGGPTAGGKLGIAYFFNCRWGLGISFAGEYFDNKATAMSYHLMALPITAGVRCRF